MSHQPDGISTLTCTFRADEGHEVHTILKSVAAREHCTQAQALLQLIRQQTTATVVLNLYAPQDNHQPVNFGGTHTLDATAAAEWLDRVTRTRDIDYYVKAYTPAYRIPRSNESLCERPRRWLPLPRLWRTRRGVRHRPRCSLRPRRGHRASQPPMPVSPLPQPQNRWHGDRHYQQGRHRHLDHARRQHRDNHAPRTSGAHHQAP